MISTHKDFGKKATILQKNKTSYALKLLKGYKPINLSACTLLY